MEMELGDTGKKEKPSRIRLQDVVPRVFQYQHDYSVDSLCWSPNGRYLASSGFLDNTKIFDVTTGKMETEYKRFVGQLCWVPGKYKASDGSDDRRVDLEHNGWLKCAGWSSAFYQVVTLVNPNSNRKREIDCSAFRLASLSPNGMYIATCRGHRKVYITSLIPFLLATHQLQEDATVSQRQLLKRLQEKLLDEKRSCIIDQSDRYTLEEMPKLKELLMVEHKSKGKKPTWKVQLNGIAKK